MNNTSFNVSSPTQTVTLQPGEFRIFGNQPAETLGTNDLIIKEDFDFKVLNNPVQDQIIQVKYNSLSKGKFNLFNIHGQLILTQSVDQGEGFISLKVPTKDNMLILVFENQNDRKSEKVLIK